MKKHYTKKLGNVIEINESHLLKVHILRLAITNFSKVKRDLRWCGFISARLEQPKVKIKPAESQIPFADNLFRQFFM